VLVNRGWLWALSEGRTNREVPELDARFERLVAERGKDEASAAVGAGGAAERERALNRT
jgi:hypothetical protein